MFGNPPNHFLRDFEDMLRQFLKRFSQLFEDVNITESIFYFMSCRSMNEYKEWFVLNQFAEVREDVTEECAYRSFSGHGRLRDR